MGKRHTSRLAGPGGPARSPATRRRGAGPPAVSSEPGARATGRPDHRTASILIVFTVAFVLLSVRALTETSATWDEPVHLTAGHAALTRQDYRLDPSHPPAVRMWAALPTLFMQTAPFDPGAIDRASPSTWLSWTYRHAREFLYTHNDADRLLYPARLMVVSLGVLLGLLLFRWARAWLGPAPAVAALAFYTFEPNLLSHASLVTTDFGVTCFLFGTVYCAWRLHHGGGRGAIAGLAACASLAVLSKFSGLLVAPVIAALLGFSVARGTLSARRCLLVLGIVAATSVVSIWAVYGFRHLPSPSPAWAYALHATAAGDQVPLTARIVEWVDTHRLLPNAFTQGAVYTLSSLRPMPAFLNGDISQDGWWYYFPAALLLKTPLALLALVSAGLVVFVRRRHALGLDNQLFVLLPVAAYLGVAMASGVNLGLRHILPIYPFLLLVAAAAVREIVRLRRPAAVAVLALAGVAWGTEFARSYPHTLSFFNQIAGGPGNGHRYLADSNLSWGQSLKGLKTWMDRNGVSHVNLAYFGQADAAYYDIDCTWLPGSPAFAVDLTSRPRLPGYVAISSTVLSGVYLPPWLRLFYEPFHTREPTAVIGHAMRVYWVDQWPVAAGEGAAAIEPDVHRQAGDALLLGFEWGAQAVLHYEQYLRAAPDDAGTLVHYGIALVAADRPDEGVTALRRAVAADPDHGSARLTLTRALIGAGDLAGAALHAEEAARLLPNDPEARQLLDRVRAIEHGLRRVPRANHEGDARQAPR